MLRRLDMESTLLSDAERMDRHYRFQRYIYDATQTYYLIGRHHLIRELNPAPGQSVLEFGCGTAWNLVRVVRAYPAVDCYGIDVSEAMLETARGSVSRNMVGRPAPILRGCSENGSLTGFSSLMRCR